MATRIGTAVTNTTETVIGMLGIRLASARRHPEVFGLSLAAWLAVTIWYAVVFCTDLIPGTHRLAAVVITAATWAFYYGGLTVVLGTRVREWMLERYGEDKALAAFNGALGLGFACQAYAHGAINAAFSNTMTVKFPAVWVACGAVLVAAGLLTKVWAASVTSLDTYYCNDMFLGRPVNACPEYVARGPYRFMRNPMYSVGNFSGYGMAMMAMSWQGLVLAVVFQASIYGFNHLVEKPFVQRVYMRTQS